MTRNGLTFTALALAALCGPLAPPVAAQTPRSYTAVPLGSVTSALGINDAGQVVGQARATAWPNNSYACFWQNGVLTDLGAGVASGINNFGQMVGNNSQPHAMLWKNGMATDLGTLPGGRWSYAYGINDAGQVVGQSERLDPQGNLTVRAFLWDSATGMHDLGTLGGTYSCAYAINSVGQVVGVAADANGISYPFRWTPSAANATTGTMVALGTLSGTAKDINDSGEVVGGTGPMVRASSTYVWEPVRWDSSGGAHPLAKLPGRDAGLASAINNAGEVAGNCSYEVSYVDPEGFLYYYENYTAIVWDSDGTVIDLNALLPSGYSLTSANGINNSGQVAAGSTSAGFLLTPSIVPAPQNLVATAGALQVSLSWQPVSTATGYRVCRSTTSGGSYARIATVTGTSYSDVAVTVGTFYYYVVTAVNSQGQESGYSNQAGAAPYSPPLAAPTNLSAIAGKKQVSLKWTQSSTSGVTQNRIYRATTNGGPYSLRATLSVGTSYTDSSVTTGITYYYVVTALKSGQESANSNQATAKAR